MECRGGELRKDVAGLYLQSLGGRHGLPVLAGKLPACSLTASMALQCQHVWPLALYGPRKRSRAENQYFAGLGDFPDRYNVAPTQMLPIARLVDGATRVTTAKWGLILEVLRFFAGMLSCALLF